MSLPGLVDLVYQIVWYLLAILLHPKGFSNRGMVQNDIQITSMIPKSFLFPRNSWLKKRVFLYISALTGNFGTICKGPAL